MPMEHKAYLFDYQRFAEELKPILEEALAIRNAAKLFRFVEIYRASLRHPTEGTALVGRWERMFLTSDPQEYGDFALTRYYQPDNIGLVYEWEEIQDIIAAARPGLIQSPILGEVVGPPNNPFDPGKLGSYFQSTEDVRASLALVKELASEWGTDLLASAITMLEAADKNGGGLYVTF